MDTDHVSAFLNAVQTRPSCYEDDVTNPAALSDAALELLGEAVAACGVRRVFEFGSGRSTGFFLQAGIEVTSVEDSKSWTQATLAQTAATLKPRLDLRWQPLQLIWLQGAPYSAWKLSADLAVSLQKAELVLIDSPIYTGFREAVLFQVLNQGAQQLVVLDDLRIPAVAKFCRRLAAANPGLIYHHVPVGHGMGFFWRVPDLGPLRLPWSFGWWVRAWRRYLIWLLSWRQKHQHA